jgi:glucose/arabinose dehydrogenase
VLPRVAAGVATVENDHFVVVNVGVGQILVFERLSGTLHMRHIASADLADTDIDDYEMVVFDGGNTGGDTWKHVFFPRQREHYFVYQA